MLYRHVKTSIFSMAKLVKPHFLMVKTLFFLGNPMGHLLQGISASFGSGSRGASVGGGGKKSWFYLRLFSVFLMFSHL